MHALAHRILDAVRGDARAIQALARAFATGDANEVDIILSARGFYLEPAEIATCMARAEQARASESLTFT